MTALMPVTRYVMEGEYEAREDNEGKYVFYGDYRRQALELEAVLSRLNKAMDALQALAELEEHITDEAAKVEFRRICNQLPEHTQPPKAEAPQAEPPAEPQTTRAEEVAAELQEALGEASRNESYPLRDWATRLFSDNMLNTLDALSTLGSLRSNIAAQKWELIMPVLHAHMDALRRRRASHPTPSSISQCAAFGAAIKQFNRLGGEGMMRLAELRMAISTAGQLWSFQDARGCSKCGTALPETYEVCGDLIKQLASLMSTTQPEDPLQRKQMEVADAMCATIMGHPDAMLEMDREYSRLVDYISTTRDIEDGPRDRLLEGLSKMFAVLKPDDVEFVNMEEDSRRGHHR